MKTTENLVSFLELTVIFNKLAITFFSTFSIVRHGQNLHIFLATMSYLNSGSFNMIQKTRYEDIQNLTATTTNQQVTLPFSYEHLYIKVDGTDAIRVVINDKPAAAAAGGVGIYVDDFLWIRNHNIHKIAFIRDTDATADASFTIMGLSYKN